MPEFPLDQLREALAAVPVVAWSLPSSYLVTGVHHGYRRVTLVDAGRPWPIAELFDFVLEAFAPIHDAWLSWIDPGGFIVPHRDAGPWRERWQVSVIAAGEFHGAETFVPTGGHAFPVEHWNPHAVANTTEHPRVHLVLDRDVWLDRPVEPFTIYPVPAHMTGMVQRSLDGANAAAAPQQA